MPVIKRLLNPEKVNELKAEALNQLTDFVRDFFEGKIPDYIILKVIMGDLVPSLIKQAQSEDFVFMILKRSIHQTGVNLLEQNELDKIIGYAHCAILTINNDSTPKEIKNILIPIDIAGSTTKKLLWATMFAKKTNAKIQIVSALNANIDEKKSLASKNAENIKSMLNNRGIKCEVDILKVHGLVKHEEVLAYIETQKSDFIIIRKHQVALPFNNDIGDFAKEIIHGSSVPVFTVSQNQRHIEHTLP